MSAEAFLSTVRQEANGRIIDENFKELEKLRRMLLLCTVGAATPNISLQPYSPEVRNR